MTRLTEDKFGEMLYILEEIAEQFSDCGPEEWDSLEDAIGATISNLKHDLEELKQRSK